MRRGIVISLVVVAVLGLGVVGAAYAVASAEDEVTIALGGVAARVEAGPSAAGGLLGAIAQAAGSEVVVRADVVVRNGGFLSPTLRSARFALTLNGAHVADGGTKVGASTPIAAHGITIVPTETRAPVGALVAAGLSALGQPTVQIGVEGVAELDVLGIPFSRAIRGTATQPIVGGAKPAALPR